MRHGLGMTLLMSLALQACAMDVAETEVGGEEEQELGTTQQALESGTTLTLFSEAGFWGPQQLTVNVTPTDDGKASQIVPTSQLQTANMLNRASSLRLRCGSRKSQVVLFDGNNSGGFETFDPAARAAIYTCEANQVKEVNLHTDAPFLADRVRSLFVIAHAKDSTSIPFSVFVRDAWNQELPNKLPAGASARGGAVLTQTASHRFTLRQDLRLDHWACTARNAHLTLRAEIFTGATQFGVIVAETHVDTGFGDLWSCKDKMRRKLAAAADNAKQQLKEGIDAFPAFLGNRPQHYFVPTDSIHDFDIWAGAANVVPPVPVDPDPTPVPDPSPPCPNRPCPVEP